MNENIQSFRILNSPEGNPFEGIKEALRQGLLKCDLEELKKVDQTKKDRTVNASTLVFDEFLKEKFNGIGISEFMKIYTKKHVGEEFCLPVPSEITCIFNSSDDPEALAKFLANYKQTIGTNHFTGNTFLNLHNNNVYEFTLIRAEFSLDEHKNLFWAGYHHSHDNFKFFIKSSAQFDLTVVYNDK